MTDAAEPETKSVLDELGIGPREVELRKRFLDFTADDVLRLTELRDLARRYADPVIEDFYSHLLAFDETRAYFKDPRVLERVKGLQKRYFLGLTEGEYGLDYAEGRVKIGIAHERIDLVTQWYLGAYMFYVRAVGARLWEHFRSEPDKAFSSFMSLLKLVFFDMGLAIETYLHRREKIISAQQSEIRELSTPVLRIKDRLLAVPMIGLLDAERAHQLTDHVLRAIRENRAKVVLIDITGVPTVDSAVANHLIQTIQAARLLGARTIVTGVSPEIAQTLVRIGVDVARLHTLGDLQEGLEEAYRVLEGRDAERE